MTPSGGDSDIVGALNNIVAAISGGGGGGMPADYPFEPTSVFNDNVVITDSDVEIDLSSTTSDPSTWTVKIDGVELTHTGTNSFEAVGDDTVYNLWEESGWYLEVWDLNADTIKPGTYSVQIDEMAIDENFRSGVEACGTASNIPDVPEETYYSKSLALTTNRDGKPTSWEEILPSRRSLSTIDNKQYIVSGTNSTLKYRELFNDGPWSTYTNEYVILKRYRGPQSDESPIFDQCAIDDIPDAYLDQSVTYSFIKRSNSMGYGWALNFPPCNEATNGTYTLKCTVNNGTKTYTWVLDS